MKRANGRLVVLDGVSSAGKSSIVRELLYFNKTYKGIAIDDYGNPIFLEQQKNPVPRDGFLSKLGAAEQKMFHEISQLLATGQNIILDTVLAGLQGIESIERNLKFLNPFNGILILIYCPLGILVQRLLARNKKAREQNRPEDERTLTHALQQFSVMYKRREHHNEVVLGQLSKKEVLDACHEVLPEFKGDEDVFANFKAKILQNLGLLDNETMPITTRIPYNFIVSTAQRSSHDCALIIESYLKERK